MPDKKDEVDNTKTIDTNKSNSGSARAANPFEANHQDATRVSQLQKQMTKGPQPEFESSDNALAAMHHDA